MNIIKASKTFEVNEYHFTVTVSKSNIRFETWSNGYKQYCLHVEPTITLDEIRDVLIDFQLFDMNAITILNFIDNSECYHEN